MIAIGSCGHPCDDERIYHKQINTLVANGYLVKYFTYSSESYMDEDDHDNIEYRFFNSSEISQKQYKKILFNLLNNEPPQIFHIHDMELLPIAFKLKKKHPDISIIYDVHEDLEAMWDTFSSYSGLIKKFINTMLSKYEKQYLSCVDQFILANRLANKKRYEQYNNCLIIENFPLLKMTNHRNISNPTQLLYHGQLSDERGIAHLVDAFQILSKKNSNLELLLIGNYRKNDFQKTLATLVGNNEKIKILSQVKHYEIWNFLKTAHIGIIPFKNVPLCQKNTPTKLFEYMLADCAIVASDLKPIREFCNQSASWAEPGDVNSLVKAISYYLDNNDKYIEHIKTNNDLIQTDYHWEAVSDKLLNLYRKLLN